MSEGVLAEAWRAICHSCVVACLAAGIWTRSGLLVQVWRGTGSGDIQEYEVDVMSGGKKKEEEEEFESRRLCDVKKARGRWGWGMGDGRDGRGVSGRESCCTYLST